MKHVFHVVMAIVWPTWLPATEPTLHETAAISYDKDVWGQHLRVAGLVFPWIAAAIGLGL